MQTRADRWLCFSDGLGGITESHPDLNVDPDAHEVFQIRPTHKSGVEVALEILNAQMGRTVTYIVLGPMTTLAHLVRQHGERVRERIGRVICMGGALDVPGNTSPVAECK